MGSCQLMLEGHARGTVSWHAEAGRLLLVARCPFEPGYIYRLMLGQAGREDSLGVMMPQGEQFVLKKTLDARRYPALLRGAAVGAHIQRARLPGACEDEAAPPEPAWPPGHFEPVTGPIDLGDTALEALVQAQEGMLCREGPDILYIAYPLRLGGESRFAPYFALTHVVERSDETLGVIVWPKPLH